MNFGDILIRVQREFGDEDEVQLERDDVLRWTNDAQLEIARKTEAIVRTLVLSGHQSQAVYKMKRDFLKIRDVFYDGNKLNYVSIQDLDKIAPTRAAAPIQTGIPNVFSARYRQVFLWPAPDANGKRIQVEYIARPRLVIEDEDELELPEQYQAPILSYCMSHAYMLDGNMVPAQARNQEFETKSNALIGDPQWSSTETYPMIGSSVEDW